VASAQLCYSATKVRQVAEWLLSLVLAALTFLASAEQGRQLVPVGSRSAFAVSEANLGLGWEDV
jgi:hypothetical protein